AQNEQAATWPAVRKNGEEPLHRKNELAEQDYAQRPAGKTLIRASISLLDLGIYRFMIPRLTAMVTACVRSFAPSFDKMFFTCIFAVSSETDSLSARDLLEFPASIKCKTSISRGVSFVSPACSAICVAIS